MNKIKFNKSLEIPVETYGKNTYFNGETITSDANCTLNTNNMTALNTLAASPITAIQIYADENLIYELDNINAKVNSINEYLNGDRMSVSMNITFQTLDN